MLIDREFSGDASFVIGGDKNNVALMRLKQGLVVSIFYSNLSYAQALKAIAWNNEAELKLTPQPVFENPPDYYHIVEDFMKEGTLLPNSDNYPILMNVFISRAFLCSTFFGLYILYSKKINQLFQINILAKNLRGLSNLGQIGATDFSGKL